VKKIHFVAMGDSLTTGLIPTRSESQPYSGFLKECCEGFLKGLGRKDALQIEIVNRGVNGDLTSDMLLRFRQDVVNLKPDYVIILGGSNDLGWGFPVQAIFSNLQRMFEASLVEGIRPVGCTVPSVLGWDEGIPLRIELNRLLRDFCCTRKISCADLFAATCDPETRRLRLDYSSDGLHLNVTGYRKIAETIFEESVKMLLVRMLDIG